MSAGPAHQPRRTPGIPYALDSELVTTSLSYRPQKLLAFASPASAPWYTSSDRTQAPCRSARATIWSISSDVRAAPVGLLGWVTRISPAPAFNAVSSSSRSGRQPVSSRRRKGRTPPLKFSAKPGTCM